MRAHFVCVRGQFNQRPLMLNSNCSKREACIAGDSSLLKYSFALSSKDFLHSSLFMKLRIQSLCAREGMLAYAL